jgi:hypothetical protein
VLNGGCENRRHVRYFADGSRTEAQIFYVKFLIFRVTKARFLHLLDRQMVIFLPSMYNWAITKKRVLILKESGL